MGSAIDLSTLECTQQISARASSRRGERRIARTRFASVRGGRVRQCVQPSAETRFRNLPLANGNTRHAGVLANKRRRLCAREVWHNSNMTCATRVNPARVLGKRASF